MSKNRNNTNNHKLTSLQDIPDLSQDQDLSDTLPEDMLPQLETEDTLPPLLLEATLHKDPLPNTPLPPEDTLLPQDTPPLPLQDTLPTALPPTTIEVNPETARPKLTKSLSRSTPLAKPLLSADATLTQLIQLANESKNLNMQVLIKNLEDLQLAFSRRVQTNPQQAGDNMMSLHRVLLQLINGEKSQAQFRQQWEYLLQMFKENPLGGFSADRLYRGAPFWANGHDEYQTFQALLNAIDATNRWGMPACRKYINFVKLTKDPISEAGRGRLLSFYN